LSVSKQKPIFASPYPVTPFLSNIPDIANCSAALRRDGHNLTTNGVTVIVLLDCMENWQQRTMTRGRFGLR